MKKILFVISLTVAFMCGAMVNQMHTDKETKSAYTLDDVAENYLLDVIDETDFWYECDSAVINQYDVDDPSWMLNVIIEYTKWSNK